MPNTPTLVGEGVSALYCVPGVPDARRRLAVQVLEAVGRVIEVDDEALLDPVTAVSGSGPAYVFLFIEALEQAARELGIAPGQARILAVQTFAGAAALASRSDEEISALRERVTSKGGTTERALASMRNDRVVEAIVRAVHAANERSWELGAELGRQHDFPDRSAADRDFVQCPGVFVAAALLHGAARAFRNPIGEFVTPAHQLRWRRLAGSYRLCRHRSVEPAARVACRVSENRCFTRLRGSALMPPISAAGPVLAVAAVELLRDSLYR
jgi:hypothetical protein